MYMYNEYLYALYVISMYILNFNPQGRACTPATPWSARRTGAETGR